MPLISTRLPPALALAMALAMIATTAWQGYRFWQTETVSPAMPVQSAQIPRASEQPQVPQVELSTVTLFGDQTQTVKAPDEDIDNLPETNLKLVLRGVMSASGDLPGSALVEDNNRQTEAYIVGDELPGNATLRKVRPNRIIIERSGALENLFFPENEDRSGIDFAVNETTDNITAQGEPEYANPQARPASFPGPSSNPTSDSRREEIRQRLEQLRNRLRNNN